MEYSGIFKRKAIITKSATLIFHFFLSIFLFLYNGLWNIPKLCLKEILFQILEYGIFYKKRKQKNIEVDVIRNIREIFLKNSKTIKIFKIIEYGIFHEIFQEYY